MSIAARRLIGREDELEAIERLLLERDGLPAAVLLYGEAGIGKTSVLAAAVESAAAHGYRLLSARPAEVEIQLSYAGLADLLGGVAGHVLPCLPPVQRHALEAALLLGEPGPPADDRAVAAALVSTLHVLAADGPVCVTVDDLQWLDAASLAAVRFALARLDEDLVAVLLAARGDPPAWLRRALPETRLDMIEVTGLSVGALRELLLTRFEAAFPRPTLIRLWETSAGNPLFALELAGALVRRDGGLSPGEELPVPSDLDELLGERLRSLDASAIDVARVVSLVAGPTVSLVEEALGARCEDGLAAALDARILEREGDRLRFTHPLLGTAVASRLMPARRRALHALLAEVVGTTEERARHLALATTGANPEIASLLEEAAETVSSRGAPAAAAELAEHAHRLTPTGDSANRARRLLAAAARHHAAGDSAKALPLVGQARRESAPGPERAAALRQIAELEYDLIGPQEALSTYRHALAEAAGDPALEASIHHGIAMSLRHTGPMSEGLVHAAAAVAAASRAGDAALSCQAEATYGLLHFDAGLGIPHDVMLQALERERTLPAPRQLLATQVVAHHAAGSGDVEAARSSYRAILSEWAARDEPYQYDPLFQLAVLELGAGNWDEASRHCERAIELMHQSGRERMLPILELPRAGVAAFRGRLDEARECCARLLAATTGNIAASSTLSQILGFVALSEDDNAQAVVHLQRSAELRDELGAHEPGSRVELGDLLEALVANGQLNEADDVLSHWEPRAAALDRARALALLARGRGLLLAARGDFDSAFASLERALAEHERTIDRFQHPRTLLALGRTQRRGKKRAAARATLVDALSRFETLGAPLWAEKTRAELARIGGRVASRDELTQAERRIAALVAEGRTNREVAGALFLTEHSVETALTRIYRKLGVRSRTELSHRLAANI